MGVGQAAVYEVFLRWQLPELYFRDDFVEAGRTVAFAKQGFCLTGHSFGCPQCLVNCRTLDRNVQYRGTADAGILTRAQIDCRYAEMRRFADAGA